MLIKKKHISVIAELIIKNDPYHDLFLIDWILAKPAQNSPKLDICLFEFYVDSCVN